jgi:hypothetical protein
MGIGAGLAAVGTALGASAATAATTGIAAVGLGTSLIGAGVSAVGALSSSSAQSKASNYQAQVAKNNAQVASQNAETATQAGQAEATTQSLKNRAALGAATSGIAANGVDVTTGSAAQSRESQREEGQLDTMTTVNNSALQAYGYRTQSVSDLGQASLDTATGANAAAAGGTQAAGDLLSGASSVGLSWAKLQNSGALAGGSP